MQDTSAKGKKVLKKANRLSEMTVALKEYTAMTRENHSDKKGKSSGTSEGFAQFAAKGDPCSLRIAIAVLNQYDDLGNKAYVKNSKAFQQKDNRVVFMGMPEHKRKTWMDDIVNPED